jgi:effector-binding domain-containing protein
MSYDVRLIQLPEERVATIRFSVDGKALAYAVESALSDVWSFLEEHDSGPAGTPFSIAHHMELDTPIPAPSPWDIEAGFPILEKLAGTERIRVRVLSAGPAAAITHGGDYEGLGDAFRVLQAWIEAMDRQVAAPPRVLYLTDPAAELETGNWRTEIVWPLLP